MTRDETIGALEAIVTSWKSWDLRQSVDRNKGRLDVLDDVEILIQNIRKSSLQKENVTVPVNDPFEEKLEEYRQAILADWKAWSKVNPRPFEVTFERGSKYIRVVQSHAGQHRGVHSFIVVKKTKRYPVGTILKAATWKSPAQNFARGDIFIPASYEKRVRWTGII